MGDLTILSFWQKLLPSSAVVSAGPFLYDAPALTPREEESVGPMDDHRRIEFTSGRAYAKRALSKLGFARAELLVGIDRAPVWPEGTTGSITHTNGVQGGHVAAVVGATKDIKRIGIDAEVDQVPEVRVWKEFLNEDELNELRDISTRSRSKLVAALWCVKESTLKALDPLADPKRIRVSHASGSLKLAACVDSPETWRIQVSGNPDSSIWGRTICLRNLMMSAVVV